MFANVMDYLITTLLVLSTARGVVHAHDDGMNMNMDTGPSLMEGHMLPYLHFTRGDTLWFLGWVPASAGAMVGACIGLFLLALVDRWLSASRAAMERHWSRRAHVLTINKLNTAPLPAGAEAQKKSSLSLKGMRAGPPFIPAHDITRGIMHMGQAALGFAFMLAVMTFQVGFIIAIVVGLGVGEMLFGRFTNAAAYMH